MDNILISMINASKLQKGEMKKEAQDTGDDFEQIFKDQFDNKAKKKDEQSSARKVVSEEHTSKDKKTSDRDELQKKMQERNDPKDIAQLKKQNPILAALLEAGIRNLDTMSLRDKQAYRLDVFSNTTGIGLKELEKMLIQRGLSLNLMTYQEIAELTKKHDRNQVISFLDELIRERRESQKIQAPSGAVQSDIHQEGRPAAKVDEMQSAKDMAEEAEKQIKRQEVLDQIIKHIEVKTLEGGSEVAIRMNPEFLGQLKIKLQFTEGKITASFDTTSAFVREILEGSQDELVSAFSEKGIKLSGYNVRVIDEEEMT